MAHYSTQADLEKYLQVDFTAEPEPVVTMLLVFAEAVIDTYTDRTFLAELGIIETFDGNGDGTLFLSKWPVTGITSVVEDGVTLTVDVDFLWYPDGRLVRGSADVDWRWTRARQGVVATYDGGYGSVPDDIRMVSTRIAGRMFQASAAYANAPVGANGVRSISLDGSDQVEFSDAVADVSASLTDLSPIDKTILSRYRRRNI